MRGDKDDIDIDETLTYSITSESFNKPLRITNRSTSIYVFKIKTNQKTVISMQATHDFIKPNSIKEIIVKLADKPSETTPLKLEINYVIPTEQEIRINDSKMNSYGKDMVFKKIMTIKRDDNAPASQHLSASKQLKKQEQTSNSDKHDLPNTSFSTVKQQTLRQYPSLSLSSIKVQSQQITISANKSQQINIKELIEVPKSSEEAVRVYQSAIAYDEEPNKQTVISEKMKFESNKEQESYTLVTSSPLSKKVTSNIENKDNNLINDLKEQIEKQRWQIKKLKSIQNQSIKQTAYPVPIIFLFVALAFIFGSLISHCNC